MTQMPASQTIPALLDEQAVRLPDNEALVSGSRRLSYRTLAAETRVLAKAWMALGVERGDHVAILMGNRIEWVLAFLSLQRLGAVVVGLNTWATPRELAHSIRHADVKFLFAVDRFRKADYRRVLADMAPLARTFPKLARIVWLQTGADAPIEPPNVTWTELMTMGQEVTDEALELATRSVVPEDATLLLHTSGSTAAPKGIVLQHCHWIRNAWHIGERQRVTPLDRFWLGVSLFWSFASVNALANVLSHGACAVLQEHFDADEALELIERERCSIIYGTPNITQTLLDRQATARRDLSSLRSGAMIGTPEQMMTAVALGAKQICQVYGLSETYGNCTLTDADDPLDVRLRTVGRALPDVRLRICHIETGAELGADEVGEIRVKGPLFSAYYGEPDKTREAYDEAGFFRTGDLGMLDADARLHFRGRLKEMVKSGGINIAPIEVEETLMRHPAVHTAYVVGLPDPVLDEVLAAVLICADNVSLDIEAVKVFCKKELAAYKVPTHFRFATHDELPMTTTGKIQKARLKELFGAVANACALTGTAT